MDVRRRSSKPVAAPDSPNTKSTHSPSPVKCYVDEDPSLKVPPSLYFFNASVIFVFFTVLYYLLSRWRVKIRSSSPLHVLSAPELAALLAFAASSVYLLGFFGVEFFQSLILRPPSDIWAEDYERDVKDTVSSSSTSIVPQVKLEDKDSVSRVQTEKVQTEKTEVKPGVTRMGNQSVNGSKSQLQKNRVNTSTVNTPTCPFVTEHPVVIKNRYSCLAGLTDSEVS